ncbi:hypothetical protein SK128_012283, partial [Halocaridina rubra]
MSELTVEWETAANSFSRAGVFPFLTGIPSEEVQIRKLSRNPDWISFAVTILKGFEYVVYKLNQWPTGMIVLPFCGGKQQTQPGLATNYPKQQTYRIKQQRAYEISPISKIKEGDTIQTSLIAVHARETSPGKMAFMTLNSHLGTHILGGPEHIMAHTQ